MEGDGGVGGGAYLCFTGRVVSVGFTGRMGLKGFKRILLYFLKATNLSFVFIWLLFWVIWPLMGYS